jgi:magnesium transporter
MPLLRRLRNELLLLRKSTLSHREALAKLMRHPNELITEETRVYLRDCHDHTVQLLDVVETYRELTVDLRELHFAVIGNRTNETMKVLTIIATIFIPLSFIAGLYGMNFDPDSSPWNMPEVRWFYGYPFALGIMGGCVAGLLCYIWRRGWFRS